MNDKEIIRVEDVYKSYRIGKVEIPVLKGVTFSIAGSGIFTLMGPSGSGKSTLLNIVGTLDFPDKGNVIIDSKDILRMNNGEAALFRNSRIGFVFQFHHLLPEFTAIENVAMPGFIRGDDKDIVLDKAEKLLTEVGLSHRLEHKPNELSGGEQQRTAVARALINDPVIVLADEPTGNLDSKNSDVLFNLIKNLAVTKNQLFFIATHNETIAGKSDKIIQLSDGKVNF